MKISRQIIVFLLAISCAMPLLAQKVQLKVGYDYEVNIGGEIRKNDYILLSGKDGSMFYNPTAL